MIAVGQMVQPTVRAETRGAVGPIASRLSRSLKVIARMPHGSTEYLWLSIISDHACAYLVSFPRSTIWVENANFSYATPAFNASIDGFTVEICMPVGVIKNRMMAAPGGEKFGLVCWCLTAPSSQICYIVP